jgi:hypothetical protein
LLSDLQILRIRTLALGSADTANKNPCLGSEADAGRNIPRQDSGKEMLPKSNISPMVKV